MKTRNQQGGALPAAIVLQLIFLLVGLQIAMSATVMRLAVARTGAMVKAERLTEAGMALAATLSGDRLASALAAGGDVDVDTAALVPGLAPPVVRVLDDEDGDGDPRRDSNGRVLLSVAAEVKPFPATATSRAGLVREALVGAWLPLPAALVGAWLPLPAALVDCAGGLAVCGGDDGCPIPEGRISGLSAAAVAVPESLAAGLRSKLFILAREILRRALQICADPAACDPVDDDLLRAAATGILRRLQNPTADSAALTGVQIGRLVGNLVLLAGDESGPGSIVWWDGSGRSVADLSGMVEVVEALSVASGHMPSLSDHPFPSVLQGSAEWSPAGDFCRRLPLLLAAATEPPGGEPLPLTVTIVAQSRRVAAGESLIGEGLLVLRAPLTVMAGGRLAWRGSVILAGGSLAGQGEMEILGSLVLAPDSAAPLLLSAPGFSLRRDQDLHGQAWDAAGIVLVSAWFGPPGP